LCSLVSSAAVKDVIRSYLRRKHLTRCIACHGCRLSKTLIVTLCHIEQVTGWQRADWVLRWQRGYCRARHGFGVGLDTGLVSGSWTGRIKDLVRTLEKMTARKLYASARLCFAKGTESGVYVFRPKDMICVWYDIWYGIIYMIW
jgi:hypothetical protein